MTRLIVLPFRVLRADPEIDFLAFSLSDALTTSLSGLESLVVRSSLTASALAAGRGRSRDDRREGRRRRRPHRHAAARRRSAARDGAARRGAQRHRALVADDAGAARGHLPAAGRVDDQDCRVARRSRSARATSAILKRDVPATAKAYEFYLRANQLAYASRNWTVARDLYLQCLEEDPRYAPAWARLGAHLSCHRALFRRSVGGELPACRGGVPAGAGAESRPVARPQPLHDRGARDGRARQAMLRLLERTRSRSADPELFAGLVQACRYAGLQRPAIAATNTRAGSSRRSAPPCAMRISRQATTRGDRDRPRGSAAGDGARAGPPRPARRARSRICSAISSPECRRCSAASSRGRWRCGTATPPRRARRATR